MDELEDNKIETFRGKKLKYVGSLVLIYIVHIAATS